MGNWELNPHRQGESSGLTQPIELLRFPLLLFCLLLIACKYVLDIIIGMCF